MERQMVICARLAILAAAASFTGAEAALVYNASSNTTPNAQGWAFLTDPLIGARALQKADEGLLTLDSRQAPAEQAGYFSKIPAILFAHPDHPVVDLDVSPFAIEFTMRQVAGFDLPDSDPLAFGERNRGGFAVIAISEDLTGIELQFQADHVVALDNANTAFPIGEAKAFDTTDALHDYHLWLSPKGYRLSADGSLLLQGPLRDYSAIAPPSPFNFPYTTPSFVFFGDDTGRGAALTELARLKVSALPTFGDCTGDGRLQRNDLSCVETIRDRDAVLVALNTLPGDLDGNGDVSFADFLVLANNFGQNLPSYVDGNIDLHGDVSFADFLTLSTNFGQSPSDGVAVPEPQCLTLALLGLLLVNTCLRNRQTQAIRSQLLYSSKTSTPDTVAVAGVVSSRKR